MDDITPNAEHEPAASPVEHTADAVEPTEGTPAAAKPFSDSVKIKPHSIAESPAIKNGFKVEGYKENTAAPVVMIPDALPAVVQARVNNTENARLDDTTKNEDWSRVWRAGMGLSPAGNGMVTALEDETASFTQSPMTPDTKEVLSAKVPGFGNNNNVEGDRAVLRLFSHLGTVGSLFTVPLWHSGFWITLRAPSDAVLVEMRRAMGNETVRLGRETYGMALSSATVLTSKDVIDVAVSHLYQSSFNAEGVDIFDYISSHDIPAIVYALAGATWAAGFQYHRSCTAKMGTCTHQEKGRLDMSTLQWTNTSRLTPWHMAHMAKRGSNSVTREDVEKYQQLLAEQNPAVVSINPGKDNQMDIHLVLPKASRVFEETRQWVDGIAAVVENAVFSNESDTQRASYIDTHARATEMRLYTHFVDKITTPGGLVINQREAIRQALDGLSTDTDISVKFSDEVNEFVEKTCISLLGIMSYECTACHGKQEYTNTAEGLKSVIPVDPLILFFTLLVQKLRMINER